MAQAKIIFGMAIMASLVGFEPVAEAMPISTTPFELVAPYEAAPIEQIMVRRVVRRTARRTTRRVVRRHYY